MFKYNPERSTLSRELAVASSFPQGAVGNPILLRARECFCRTQEAVARTGLPGVRPQGMFHSGHS